MLLTRDAAIPMKPMKSEISNPSRIALKNLLPMRSIVSLRCFECLAFVHSMIARIGELKASNSLMRARLSRSEHPVTI